MRQLLSKIVLFWPIITALDSCSSTAFVAMVTIFKHSVFILNVLKVTNYRKSIHFNVVKEGRVNSYQRSWFFSVVALLNHNSFDL